MAVVVAITALLTGACVPDPAPPRAEKERVDLSASGRDDEPVDDAATTGPAVEATDESAEQRPPGHPERPRAMDRTDDLGAAAAAAYFVELERYAFRTGDLTEWIRISEQACKWCWLTAANVAAIFGIGDSTVGGETAMGIPVPFEVDPDQGVYGFTFELTSEPMQRVDPEGAVVGSANAQHVLFDIVVAHTPDGWRMLFGLVRSPDSAGPSADHASP
ncbi:hypothetical protein GCM10010972_14170 [Cellulomonas carbonis]|uniref:DUF6318 domain-containing protein n=2 Tax=Cellulomonas carbonis TaxID=1386092 RepID=A0A0A0BSQ5_9CELL|nr:hypothetical protein N868_12910 [Cellulomonas carbonis T26]GGC02405.1 hypothetical protein GCM10010972_14170 [Cellulomonas carbonis]